MTHPTVHGTTTGDGETVDSVTINTRPGTQLAVISRGGGDLWYTLDGSDPDVDSDGSYVRTMMLPAAIHRVGAGSLVVKLLSATPVPFSVEVY